MSANAWVKIISFCTLGIIAYVLFTESPSQRAFNQLLLTQPPNNQFTEGFEELTSTMSLFPDTLTRWHQIGRQQNEIRLINNPNQNCITAPYECDMPEHENHLKLTREQVYRGKQALKLVAKPSRASFSRKSNMTIRRHNFDFGEGDDLYFSGWFYLENDKNVDHLITRNLAFMGFRSAPVSWRYRKEPGRFLQLDHHNYIASDLWYWLPKPEPYKQTILEEVSLPFNRWVNLRVHIKFSAKKTEGLVQVWQNGEKILYYPGQTLPEPTATYSIMELGILNHEDSQNTQTLYLDDLRISDKAFFKL